MATIAIIGLLIGLLLPAIQSARESARQVGCRNNLKQLALGLLHYESSEGALPPALTFIEKKDQGEPALSTTVRPNWVVLLLPYMEQLPLYNSIVPTAAISDSQNSAVRGTRLPVMLCPTDSFNGTAYDGAYYSSGPWARGNYAANGGRGYLLSTSFPGGDDWKDKKFRGVMGWNMSARIASILDGTSNTILLGEVRAGLSARDARGTWALSGSPSSLWAYGSGGGRYDDNGPNAYSDNADDFVDCASVVNDVGRNVMRRESMMCCTDQGNWQQTTRSMHRGGVNMAFCDGGVRFISDWIETTASFGSVWDRLILSADGLALDWSQVER